MSSSWTPVAFGILTRKTLYYTSDFAKLTKKPAVPNDKEREREDCWHSRQNQNNFRSYDIQ